MKYQYYKLSAHFNYTISETELHLPGQKNALETVARETLVSHYNQAQGSSKEVQASSRHM
jgi:hypothetical protein